MRNAGLEETQAGIKIGRRNISNLRYSCSIFSERLDLDLPGKMTLNEVRVLSVNMKNSHFFQVLPKSKLMYFYTAKFSE